MAKNKKKENPVPEDVQDQSEAVPQQEAQEAAEAVETGQAQEPQAQEAAEKPQKDQGQLLAEAADITLIDHLIFAGGDMVSMAESGLLRRRK